MSERKFKNEMERYKYYCTVDQNRTDDSYLLGRLMSCYCKAERTFMIGEWKNSPSQLIEKAKESFNRYIYKYCNQNTYSTVQYLISELEKREIKEISRDGYALGFVNQWEEVVEYK